MPHDTPHRLAPHCLLPIIPRLGQDARPLLDEFLGKPLLLHLLDTLAAVGGMPVHILTTEPVIADFLRGRGVGAHCEAAASGFADREEAVRFAVSRGLARGLFPPSAPLLILDCRNPFLSAETIAACRRQLEADPEILLASFEVACDHPPQQFQAFVIEAVETLVFLDPSPAARELAASSGVEALGRVSFPFFFDWRGQGVWAAAPGGHVMGVEPGRHLVRPRPAPGGPQPLAGRELLLLWDSPWSARRVVPLDLIGDERAAHPAYAPRSALPAQVFRRAEGLVVRSPGRDDSAERLVRLWPLDRTMPATSVDVSLPDRPQAELALPVSPAAGGVVAALMARVRDGAFDHAERTVAPGLWTVDPGTLLPADAKTGRPLLHRQDFPELLTRDDAVLGGRAESLLRREEPAQGWRPVPLDETERIKIRDRLDAVRARTVLTQPGPAWSATAFAPPEDPVPAAAAVQPEAVPRPPAPACDEKATARPGPRSLCEEALSRAEAEALSRQLAWRLWGHERIRDSFSPPGGQRRDSGFAHAILGNRIGHDRRQRDLLHERASGIQRDGADSRGPARLAAVPHGDFPRAPRKAASDQGSILYLCGRWAPGRQSLFRKDLRSGETRDIGLHEGFYCGVWHDLKQGLLYGQFWKDQGGVRAGVDVFHPEGEHVARIPFNPARFHDVQYLNSLQGNEKSLFCMDYSCWLIYELDKSDLSIRDVHDFPHIRGVSDFKCDDEGIYFCNTQDCLFGFYSFIDKSTRYASSLLTSFPTKIEVDHGSGNTYVLTLAGDVQAGRPRQSRLQVFDRGFNHLRTVALGEASVEWLCAAEASRRLVILDLQDGVSLLPLDGDGAHR